MEICGKTGDKTVLSTDSKRIVFMQTVNLCKQFKDIGTEILTRLFKAHYVQCRSYLSIARKKEQEFSSFAALSWSLWCHRKPSFKNYCFRKGTWQRDFSNKTCCLRPAHCCTHLTWRRDPQLWTRDQCRTILFTDESWLSLNTISRRTVIWKKNRDPLPAIYRLWLWSQWQWGIDGLRRLDHVGRGYSPPCIW